MPAIQEAPPADYSPPATPAATTSTQRLFERRSQRYLRRLLPGFCAVFGISVLGAGIWSHAVDSGQSPASLVLRLALVALASFAYRMPRSGPSLAARAAFVYVIHGAALATGARSLADGMLQAIPPLFVWMVALGLLEPRRGPCIRILAPATLICAASGVLMLPSMAALAILSACLAAPLLAVVLGAATLRLRHESWLRERQLLQACRYDNLSGALSRAYVTELARHDLSLAQRHRRSLAVAMLDIDHFKRVNDLHGHAVGDAVIRALTASCMKTLRATDYLGRVGGEEFVCVLPEADAQEARICAERMRNAFANLQIPGAPPDLRCTVSIGVSVYGDQPDWETLLREADAALYDAKEAGRNQVVVANTPRHAAA